MEALGIFDLEETAFRPLGLRCLSADLGLRLRVRALFSTSESVSCSSAIADGDVARLAAERVIGAK